MEVRNNNRTSEINKLQGEYLTSNLNEVWTVDITTIKNKYYFFFIVDLASRRIVDYDVSQHDYSSTEASCILYKALETEDNVKPSRPVKFVHTDSAGIFLSNEWMECLKVNNITPSSSDSKNHQNQVSERFNRTFKKILRDKLNKLLNKGNNKTSTLQLIGEATKYNFKNLKEITKEIINTMYDLEKKEIIPFVPLSKNGNSEIANEIRKWKKEYSNLLSTDFVSIKIYDTWNKMTFFLKKTHSIIWVTINSLYSRNTFYSSHLVYIRIRV